MFGKNKFGRKISLFAICAQALCMLFSCGNFLIGDEGDIKEEIESAYVTEYKFYYEDPRKNPYAKLVTVKYKIDETMSEDEFFPKTLAQGYKASNWVCFDSKTKKDLALPPNIHTQETPNGVQVTSVLVTQKPLSFYAVSWVPRKDILYTVHHYKQSLGLASYVDTPPSEKNYFYVESEIRQGEMGALINFLECKKDYPGFEYSMNVLGETNGIITFDGTCQANIYYDRKFINVTITPNGGAFVADSGAVQKTLGGYYETPLAVPAMEKKDFHIAGFENISTGEIIETLNKFPPQDETYQPVWESDFRSTYKVHYMLQKISATASANSTPYVINDKTYYSTYEFAAEVELEDYIGRKTKAQKATAELIPNIANYDWVSTEEAVIAEDASTVVHVFYDVIPFDVRLNVNVSGGTETQIQKFCTETDCITVMPFVYTGFVPPENYEFIGWNAVPGGSGANYLDGGAIPFTEKPAAEPYDLYAQYGTFAIFVDADSGSDSNDGRREFPVKTFAAALEKISDPTSERNRIVLLTDIAEDITQTDSRLELIISTETVTREISGTINFAASNLKLRNIKAASVEYSGSELTLIGNTDIQTINMMSLSQTILLEGYTNAPSIPTNVLFDASVKSRYTEGYAIIKPAVANTIDATQCKKFTSDDYGIKYDATSGFGILYNTHGSIDVDLFIKNFDCSISQTNFECTVENPKTNVAFTATIDFTDIAEMPAGRFNSINVKVYNGGTEIPATVTAASDKKSATVSITDLYAGAYDVVVEAKIGGILYTKRKQIFVNIGS